ncbi:HAD-IIIC family phosphatase [Amycolatopsis minnesotensis]|uniref:HAD-IIIC family phosphatase n=1 Tax=Amycolatopsis minnesotensis TaxID=337894 RepID=A0ABN2QWD9_9PSEU
MSGPVKCLVWDLDNTLWQGTLLEGDEIRLSAAVRETIVELDARGILQSVASRNEPERALARLAELGVGEYLVLPEIGWGPKSDAVRRIADGLNFAHRAMAFIDDQPAERAEVSFQLPEVRCYPAAQATTLSALPEFSPAVTTDSRRRRQFYQAGFRRAAERAEFPGPDEEFLRSLELVMSIGRADAEDLSRAEELTLRTSQLNATGVHYSRTALRGLLDDPGHEVLVVGMADRFGPHGAVGVVLLETRPEVWHLKLLATSCRVVSFGAGSALLDWLADQAARAGVHLVADFRPTDRNRMMEVAYRFAGFDERPCHCRARVDEGPGDRIQRLHLVPSRRPAPAAISIDAPALARLGTREGSAHG